MAALQYTVIKSKAQYNKYNKQLDQLSAGKSKSKAVKDEIELLTLLTGKWEANNETVDESGSVELLQSLMNDNNLTEKDLSEMLELSPKNISEVLNHKKGLPKEALAKLTERLSFSHETVSSSFETSGTGDAPVRSGSVMKTRREVVKVTISS